MSKSVLSSGILAVAVATLVTYYPATRIGFVNNDWIQLDWAARWDLPRYLYAYFVPSAEMGSYRPMYGLYFRVVYTLFGPNASAFHLAYVILHLLNGLLVFALVKRIASNLPLAAIAAMLWIGFPAYSAAVYWPSVLDPLVSVFYLGAILFWLDFLQRGRRRHFFLALLASLLTLMTKETGVTLIVVLFLTDRMLVRDSVPLYTLIRRYAPFVSVWIPYLIMEYAIQKGSSYVNLAGYGLGIHVLWNLLNSLAALTNPWQLVPPLKYVLVMIAVVLFVSVVVARRSVILALLGILIVLNLLPVIGFPTEWFEMRYLYLAAIASAIIFALVLAGGWLPLHHWRPYMILASCVVGFALVVNGTSVAEAIGGWGEIARQRAVPFREIEQNHPTFSTPTELYFVNSPIVSMYDLSVMFLLRYGREVTVGGTEFRQLANLREAPTSYVYYFDATGKPIEVPVDHDATISSKPLSPVTFSVPIRLEGFEITDSTLRRNQPLVLILYWRTIDHVDKDYTVFVHLVDSNGQMVTGVDGFPRNGNERTSAWHPDQLTADAHVIMVPQDAVPGSGYHLEIGLYYLPTMERLLIVDSRGDPIADKVDIGQFRIAQ